MQDANNDIGAALTLEKFNPLEAKLKQAAADYENLKIGGLEDAPGYKVVSAALGQLIAMRTTIEKTRKQVKEPAIIFGKKVDLEASRLTKIIAAAEVNLRNQKDWYDAAKEQQKEQLERQRLELFRERTDALFEAGFVFDGVDYIAGSLYMRADGIADLTDEKFAECLGIVRQEPKGQTPVVSEKTDDWVDMGLDWIDHNKPINSGQSLIPGRTNIDPLPPFEEDLFAAARNQHDFAFSAGFDNCKRRVLEILDRPEKIARAELIRLIVALQ